jgi:hypothetical protein
MLILAHLTDRPAHGDEIKTHVERTLGGSSAIDNNLPYPALNVRLCCATIWRTLPRCCGPTSAPVIGLGAWVVQFLTRQSEQDLERRAFPAEETRGETL